MKYPHRSKGRLFFADPRDKDRGNRKFWLLMKVDPGIVDFYSWLSLKNGWNIVRGSRWGPHISIVSGEKPKNVKLWNSLPGRKYQFNYSIDLHHDGTFIWLPVQSNELEQLRMDLGLTKRPYFNFHMTIGRFKHKVE